MFYKSTVRLIGDRQPDGRRTQPEVQRRYRSEVHQRYKSEDTPEVQAPDVFWSSSTGQVNGDHGRSTAGQQHQSSVTGSTLQRQGSSIICIWTTSSQVTGPRHGSSVAGSTIRWRGSTTTYDCTASSLGTTRRHGSTVTGSTIRQQRSPSVSVWITSSQGNQQVAGQRHGSATTYDCKCIIWSADGGATCRCGSGLQWTSGFAESRHGDDS